MYVHIGDNVLIRTVDIITILDKQTIGSSEITTEFLNTQRETTISGDRNIYKSIVITKDAIYYSPIASNTLKRRSYRLTTQDY